MPSCGVPLDLSSIKHQILQETRNTRLVLPGCLRSHIQHIQMQRAQITRGNTDHSANVGEMRNNPVLFSAVKSCTKCTSNKPPGTSVGRSAEPPRPLSADVATSAEQQQTRSYTWTTLGFSFITFHKLSRTRIEISDMHQVTAVRPVMEMYGVGSKQTPCSY